MLQSRISAASQFIMSRTTFFIRHGLHAGLAAIACFAGCATLVTVVGCGDEEVVDDRPAPDPNTPPPYGGKTTSGGNAGSGSGG